MSEQTVSQQYGNDEIQVVETAKPHCKIQLEVSLSPQASERCYQQALKEIRKHISIPGFRKGKVPKDMVEDKYAGDIAKEFRQQITSLLNDACKLTGKFPIHEQTLSIQSISAKRDDRSSFVAQFETFPSVPVISPETLELQLFELQPTSEEEVKNTIRNLCYEHGEWQTIEDRPSQEGDFITVDVEQKRGDEWIGVSENVHLHLDKSKEQPWIIDNLTGVTLDHFIEAARPPEAQDKENPDEHEDSLLYRFHVTQIRTCSPLEQENLHEKLKLSDFETMQNKIREELEKFAESELKDKQRDLVYDFLREGLPFELPSLLIDIEFAHRKEKLKEKTQKEHGDVASIETFFKENRDEYRKTLEENLRAEFLLKEFIEKRAVNPTELEMRELAQKKMRDMDALMEMMQHPDKFSEKLKNEATRCKALDMIYQEAKKQS